MEALSLSAWIRDARVEVGLEELLNTLEDNKDVTLVNVHIDGEMYVKYLNLDSLYVSEGLSCVINEDIEPVVKGRNYYVYYLQCFKSDGTYAGICKVGVSRDPVIRVEQLNKAWDPKGVFFKLIHQSKGSWSKRRMYSLESAIHEVLRHKGLQYRSELHLDGYTELFWDKPFIQELI